MARRATYRAALGVALTANNNYSFRAGPSDEFEWQGGDGFLYVAGTWNGASAKLQQLAPDNTTWVEVPMLYSNLPAILAADGMVPFSIPAGPLRLNVTAAGASTSIKGWIVGVPSNTGG